MSDLIRRDDVLAIIRGRFSGLMIGDILKKDINELPAAEISRDRISRCELFNRLATISAEDANDMKAQIYAVIQEMPAIPDKAIAHVHLDTEELLERIREEYELTDDIVRCKECRKSHIDGKTTHYLWCTEWGRSTDTFGYCERGEREGE